MFIYSAKNNAFYPLDMQEDYENTGSWPDDGVEVDSETFSEFISPAPAGKVRAAGENGLPAWVDVPPLTTEEITVQNESKRTDLKRTADSEITWRQDAVDAEIATDDEVTALAAWKKYRVLLMRVDVNSPKWPKVPS